MPKYYINKNVLEAAKDRIKIAFDNFEKIYVCFSAGKDSTVLLHLVIGEAVKRNKKVGVLFVDLEAQYKLTIDHAISCFEKYKDNIELFWICLPINLRNAVSVFEPFWICWDKDIRDSWVRSLPQNCISDENYFSFFKKGMEFEEFVPQFGEWYSKGKKTCCFVGIRSDESLNRYRAISNNTKSKFNDYCFTTQISDNLFNFYPIYDWKTEDIWIYNTKYPNKEVNQLYEMMYKAGVPISKQRICQPYGDDQRRGLWLFHLIEPETWSKIIFRVNGVNSGALYISESGSINGYDKIEKPENHTWESFSIMLLSTMPKKIQENYIEKIFKFIEIWKDRDYFEGIPDQTPLVLENKKLTPSWRRVCKMILRNDYFGKTLGFNPPIKYNLKDIYV